MARPKRFTAGSNDGCTIPENIAYITVTSKDVPNMTNTNVKASVFDKCNILYISTRDGKLRYTLNYVFTDQADVWNCIRKLTHASKPLHVFCCGASIDMQLLRLGDELLEGRFTLNAEENPGNSLPMKGKRKFRGMMTDKQLPFICVMRGSTGTVKVVDVQNYIPEWSEVVKDRSRFTSAVIRQYIDTIGLSDDIEERESLMSVDLLLSLMEKWMQADGGVWKFTATQLAYTAWKHSDKTHDICYDATMKSREIERRAFYGGRNWCGFIGSNSTVPEWFGYSNSRSGKRTQSRLNSIIYQYDVNSLYPAMMFQNAYPVNVANVVKEETLTNLRRNMRSFLVIAAVLIDSPVDEYPIRLNGRTVYARGKFWTTLADPELKRALYCGHVVAVGEAAYYHSGTPFREHVSKWFDVKTKAQADKDTSMVLLSKSILNCLFGRFGQRNPNWIPCPSVKALYPYCGWSSMDAQTGEICTYRSIGFHTYVANGDKEKEESFPAISAFVTSYGREYMRSVIMRLPVGSFVYSGTDSLFVSEEGKIALESVTVAIGQGLGQFRFIGEFRDWEFRGPSNYTLNGVDVIAGKVNSKFGGIDSPRTRWESESMAEMLGRYPDGIILSRIVQNVNPIREATEHIKPDGFTCPPLVKLIM